jgi:UDP-N-acetylmuramoyl-L-alanyl-D-glutamate--2,6-diaminopimelate ligase
MMAQRWDEQSILLGDLLPEWVQQAHWANMPVKGVAQNSAQLAEGYLFIALAGERTHGMQYIADVVACGALAVVAEPSKAWPVERLYDIARQYDLPIFVVPALKFKAALIAARFFGHPAHTLRLIGITGTNGKTSVSHFLAQALNARQTTGVIGTLGNGLLNDLQTATHTTPDAVQLQAELARQLGLGVKAVAMEVSSHALAQGRVAGVPFHTAVFTNLSRDHQDYHGSMQAYAEAKTRLFKRSGLALAVINADDAMGRELLKALYQRVMLVACSTQQAVKQGADRFIYAQQVHMDNQGLHVQFGSSWGEGEIHSQLLGRFNVENLLLTLAVLLAWKIPLDAAIDALENLQPVNGRMSLRGDGKAQPLVVVDYAHTPDALEKLLSSVREHVQGEVVCVFGCGGERDQGKRPLMGEIAQRLADQVWLTDDNPRGEDGAEIIQQIRQGMQDDAQLHIQRDRATAIAQAISQAKPQDLVVVAGKGHEEYQLMGELKIPFSDFAQVDKALQEYAA